jgi:hypothetical protein
MEEQKNQRDGAQAPREESDPGSINPSGCGPVDADRTGGAAPTEPAVDSDGHAAGLDNGAAEIKRPISERKLAANRANAREHSAGPKTAAGKAKSSRNSYKHGLCSQHLLRPGPQEAQDREAYEQLATSVRNHYQPEGAIEEFLVEKIVTEMVRYARIIGHEQKALNLCGFDNYFLDKILRYSTSSERQLMRSMRELERIQAGREIVSGMSESLAAEPCVGRPHQAGPSHDVNWSCLGSIVRFVKAADEQTGEAKTQGSSQANGKAEPTGSGPGDKTPAQEIAWPPKRPLAALVTQICGLPPMTEQQGVDSVANKNCETNPPPSGLGDGGATEEK